MTASRGSVPALKTTVYIDGFNLYYRAVRRTPYRWLDPVALSRAMLPGDAVANVKYFTARVKGVPHDPGAPTRQQVYLRALRTLDGLSVEDDGFFVRRKVFYAMAIGQVGRSMSARERRVARFARWALGRSGLLKMQSDPIPRLRVWKTEEKGTDAQ